MHKSMSDSNESLYPENPELSEIKKTSWLLGSHEKWDHFLARVGFKRMDHRVAPGLYALGSPRSDSPVFVTANYTLSFDSLRSALKGIDCYILVIETLGVNVWCAAGEGTFGTDELVGRIAVTKLSKVVGHRKLILPQLSASGVNAFEVERRSGFKVKYGPIRAEDIPRFLKIGKATPDMRLMRFNLVDRLVLIPVELTGYALPLIVAVVILYLLGGTLTAAAAAVAVLSGIVLFPILLPWLPTKDFGSKGFFLGVLAALPLAVMAFWSYGGSEIWQGLVYSLGFVFFMSPVTSYIALNFTGSTPFPSRSGVKREIFRYIPAMVISIVIGVILYIVLAAIWLMG